MTNKKITKKLLAATSAAAFLSLGAANVHAATHAVDGGTGLLSSGANVFTGGSSGNTIATAAGDIYYLNDSLTLDVAASGLGGTINLYKNDGFTITAGVTAPYNLTLKSSAETADTDAVKTATGSAITAGTSSTAQAKLVYSAAATHSITSGIEYIKSIDFGNKAVTLTLGDANSAATNLGTLNASGGIISTGGDTGTLSIAQTMTISDTSVDGTDQLKLFAIGASASLTAKAVAASASLVTSSASTIANGSSLLLSGSTSTNKLAFGSITLVADSVATISLGDNTTIAAIDAYTNNTTAANTGKFVISAGDNVTIASIDGGAGTASTSITSLKVTGAVNVTGTIGANEAISVELGSSGALTVNDAAAATSVTSTSSSSKGKITFGADTTLTLSGDTLDAYIYSGAASGASAQGTVILPAATLESVAGSFKASNGVSLKQVSVSGTGTIDLGNSLESVVTLNFVTTDAKASVTSANSGLKITATTDAYGELIAANTSDLTLGDIGSSTGPKKLGKLTLKGKNVIGSGVAYIGTLSFDSAATGTFKAASLAHVGGFTTAASGLGTVYYTESTTLGGDFGTSDLPLSELGYVGASAATLGLNSNNVFAAKVTSSTDGVLSVTGIGSAASNTAYGQFGASDKKLDALTFTTAGTYTTAISGAVYAKTLTTSGQ
ncbi:MAG: hypothetical protein SFT91_02195, partial [Rickettsiaceae bacterium]|nr:hypothetical protein [Rickettsiaceae bacterium]